MKLFVTKFQCLHFRPKREISSKPSVQNLISKKLETINKECSNKQCIVNPCDWLRGVPNRVSQVKSATLIYLF